MGKKLATTVHIHREGGQTVVYEAGQEVPAEDAKLIRNDDVWESEGDGEEPRGEDNSDSGGPRVAEKRGGGNPAARGK